MGISIALYKGSSIAQVGKHEEGSIYIAGGSDEAELAITYNYAPHYYGDTGLSKEKMLDVLEGMTGQNSIPLLERAVALLGTVRDEDYWKPWKGNAGYALSILLGWARLHPDGVWQVTSR